MPTADLDDGTRLADAGTIQNNIITTALAYKLTGNTAYLTRAVAEMENAASFADWNPKKHFLDTAAIMTGMAIGYDWLYNDLSDSQKTAIAKAKMDEMANLAEKLVEMQSKDDFLKQFTSTEALNQRISVEEAEYKK